MSQHSQSLGGKSSLGKASQISTKSKRKEEKEPPPKDHPGVPGLVPEATSYEGKKKKEEDNPEKRSKEEKEKLEAEKELLASQKRREHARGALKEDRHKDDRRKDGRRKDADSKRWETRPR